MNETDEKNFERFLRQFRFRAPAPLPVEQGAASAQWAPVTQSVSPIRILIADDHEIFRDGLRLLLDAESGLNVIGEARDGAEAVERARELSPDILLLDLSMPNHPGFEALKDLGSGDPNKTHVILLSADVSKRQIVEALQLGARGVVLKDSATEFLLKAIQTVMAGGYWVGRERVANLCSICAFSYRAQARRHGTEGMA
jgi:DNA-binding NarL/FixJ family response regulator